MTEDQLKSMEGRAPLLVQVVREQRQQIEQLRSERDLANTMHEEASRQRDDVAVKLSEAERAKQLLIEQHGEAVKALGFATDLAEKYKGARDVHHATARLQATSALDASNLRRAAEERLRVANATIETLGVFLGTLRQAIADRFWSNEAYRRDITAAADQAIKVAVRS